MAPPHLVARGLSRMRALVTRSAPRRALSQRDLQQLRRQLRECAEARGGEVSARERAARLAGVYLGLDDVGRHALLRMIALEFGPDPARVALAHSSYQAAIGTTAQWEAEAELRRAMGSPRLRILTQFNAIPQGVKFLVDLRADLLRYLGDDPLLEPLDRELQAQLSSWFDVGFLELRRITWQSPAALLEKLVAYEAVHEIRSWQDLKNRLDADRRCYAWFHPRMPLEPLIFVEVALVDELAANVQKLLDIDAPLSDPTRATTAIFYSISSTQDGLRGVSLGNFLLKRVVEDLQRDLPKLGTFSTLSPIPGLVRWAMRHPDEANVVWRRHLAKTAEKAGFGEPDFAQWVALLNERPDWHQERKLASALRDPVLALTAHYLLRARQDDGRPVDSVARFHLGNGARIERLNWLGDTSRKGLAQSLGVMVNYLYVPDRIEANVEAYAENGTVDAGPLVRRWTKT